MTPEKTLILSEFEDQANLSFWDHVDELRNTILRSLLIAAFFSCLAFSFSSYWIDLFKWPAEFPSSFEKGFTERIVNRESVSLEFNLPESFHILDLKNGKLENNKVLLEPEGIATYHYFLKKPVFILTHPLDGFLITIKFSILIGLGLSSPFWVWQILNFIAPAFRRNTQKQLISFFFCSFFCFALGVLFGFKIILPMGIAYFLSVNESMALSYWSFLSYMDFSIMLLLAAGLSFEALAIMLLLVKNGIVTDVFFNKWRRLSFLACFILGALLTPPDVLSQVVLALILYSFYELAFLYAFLKRKFSF